MRRSLRFLLASDFSNDRNSGAAGSLLMLGDALRESGHVVDYIWKSPERYRLPHPRLAQLFELPHRQCRQVDRKLQEARQDVVMVSQPYAYLLYERLPSRYPNTLFLNCTHGWEERADHSERLFRWRANSTPARLGIRRITAAFRRRACRRTAGSCHGLIAPCSLCARFVETAYGIPATKVAVIPRGLEREFLTAEPRVITTSDRVRMLFVGSYIARKGTRVMESLLPDLGGKFRNASLTFVVPDHAISHVRSLYQPTFGDRLTVHGWMARKELVGVYATHDIFLFPSLLEGFGMTFLESMACGMCVIGYREGGLGDLAVSGQHALYCDVGSEAELRDLLESALQRPQEVKEIGARAQVLARQYSWLRAAEHLEDFCIRLRPQLASPRL